MCNVSNIGQFLRILVGLIFIALAWFGPQTSILSFELMHLWKFGWLGLIPLLSGISAFCPIYAVLGFTEKQNEQKP